jgi:FAD/FMN-containing dehydrogenase
MITEMADAPHDRRQFVVRAAGGVTALVLAGCGASSSTTSTIKRTVKRKVAPAKKATVADLTDAVHGQVLTPKSAGYGKATQIYNEVFDGARPVAIVRARHEEDVKAAVKWAGQADVSVVPRAGGHSYGGYSTGNGVLVVDVAGLSSVSVDRGAGVADIGGGSQLINVYSALARKGVTTPAGSCPSVGIGGHAQVGGTGLAARKFGLACDNIEGLRVVTADGSVVEASKSSNPDLYWASRGGGAGNFGVVTSFRQKVHRVSSAAWFDLSWPWSSAADALGVWQHVAPHMPDEMMSIFHLSTGASSPSVSVAGQFFGSVDAMKRLLRPLLEITGASLSSGTQAYLPLQQRWAGCSEQSFRSCHTEGTFPGGTLPRARFLAKSSYVTDPMPSAGRKAAVAAIERRQNESVGGSAALLFDCYGGVVNRVPASATAFVHRDAICCIQYLTYFSPESEEAKARRWIDGAWRALQPSVSKQAYQGYIDPELKNWESAYYGANYPRLQRIKKKYDPDFRFRNRQAIRPA